MALGLQYPFVIEQGPTSLVVDDGLQQHIRLRGHKPLGIPNSPINCQPLGTTFFLAHNHP